MDKEFIMVSVLIITYNHVHYIKQAIESVLEQNTQFAVEILVGDDHSDDGTAKILAQMAQTHKIHVNLRPKNIGATRNLYDLQCQAHGKYLAYLEGDDFWCNSQKLQEQVDFLESQLSYIGCTHKCKIVDDDGKLYKKQQLDWIIGKSQYLIQDFQGIILPGHMSTIMHHNFFLNSNGLYESLMTIHPLIGDRSLCLLLASQGKIFQMPKFMSCYRIGKGNNATSVAYELNTNWIQDDYEYTKKLESYAVQVLKVDGGFFKHKADLFVSAVWAALRHPTWKRLHLVFQFLCERKAVLYLLYFPICTARKYRNLKAQK